jgi:hypothetical protein
MQVWRHKILTYKQMQVWRHRMLTHEQRRHKIQIRMQCCKKDFE